MLRPTRSPPFCSTPSLARAAVSQSRPFFLFQGRPPLFPFPSFPFPPVPRKTFFRGRRCLSRQPLFFLIFFQGSDEPDTENDVVRCSRRQELRVGPTHYRRKEVQRGGLPLGSGVHRAEKIRLPEHAAREREAEGGERWRGERDVAVVVV